MNEPGTGYLWTNVARHGKTYRHYGEYVSSQWCDRGGDEDLPPQEGRRLPRRIVRAARLEARRAAANGRGSGRRSPILSRGIFRCWRRTSPPSRNCATISIRTIPISVSISPTNCAWTSS